MMDDETGETLVDELGRRSFTNLDRLRAERRQEHRARLPALGPLPEGRKLAVQYFGETYPVEVVGIGYKPLYDPETRSQGAEPVFCDGRCPVDPFPCYLRTAAGKRPQTERP